MAFLEKCLPYLFKINYLETASLMPKVQSNKKASGRNDEEGSQDSREKLSSTGF